MTITMHASAKQVWRMTSDAPDAESFIVLCEELAVLHLGEGLDSWDLGDALGAIIRIGTQESAKDPMIAEWVWAGFGFSITLSYDWELFDWDSPLPPPTFDLTGGNA